MATTSRPAGSQERAARAVRPRPSRGWATEERVAPAAVVMGPGPRRAPAARAEPSSPSRKRRYASAVAVQERGCSKLRPRRRRQLPEPLGERIDIAHGHQQDALVSLGRLAVAAGVGHHDGQSVAHRDVERAAQRRASIGQHHGIRAPQVPVELRVVDVAVDERDPVPVAAAREHLRGQRVALPRLPDHGQPVSLDLVGRQPVERVDEVLQALVGPDDAEEQDVADVGGRLAERGRRLALGLVVVVGAVRQDRHGLAGEVPVLGQQLLDRTPSGP